MWYPQTVTVSPASEPVTLAEAKAHCRVDGSDEDTRINGFIAAARGYVEGHCGIAIASRTVTIKCDSFSDFDAFPGVPLLAVLSISYTDSAGTTQTLPSSVYEVRSDGLTASIALKYQQAWPSIQPGSRITVTASIGYAETPAELKQALLLVIGDWYRSREDTTIGVGITQTPQLPHGVSALLANFRRFCF